MFIYVTLGYTAYTVLNLKFILIYTFTFLFYVRFQMKDYWLDPPTEQVKYIAIICLKKKSYLPVITEGHKEHGKQQQMDNRFFALARHIKMCHQICL